MQILLTSIGSRGDVQPLLALALELQALGQQARLCVAPNFRAWVESFGLPCVPIGPDLRQLSPAPARVQQAMPSAEQLRQLASHTVRAQFPVLIEAARGCDLLVGAGALQIATRSVSEMLKIPYIFAAYCPAVFPSPNHPPPKMGSHYPQSLASSENLSLWLEEERSWNDLFLGTLNEERQKAGLTCIDSVQRHIFTEEPWLAADTSLAPAEDANLPIRQTGAWLLPDRGSLPVSVERFLARGEPPVYCGFGSMRSVERAGQMLVEAARALGLRSIISRGWGNLAPIETGPDCLEVDDLPHQTLFARVAAVVHHGGAGTTVTAASTGRPQAIVPHIYDQYYWAHRVQKLGIGVTGPDRESLNADAIAGALGEILRPQCAKQARQLASRVRTDGARVAAEQLIREFGH